MTDPGPTAQEPTSETPPEVDDDALFVSFCAANDMKPDDVSWGMRNSIVALCRLTYENAWMFKYIGETWNVLVNPEPDYFTAYFKMFVDHVMPLESKNRIAFETKWQVHLQKLAALYKEKLEEERPVQKPIGLYLPEDQASGKKIIIPGQS